MLEPPQPVLTPTPANPEQMTAIANNLNARPPFRLRRKTPASALSEPGSQSSIAGTTFPGLPEFIEETTVALVLAAVLMVSVSV